MTTGPAPAAAATPRRSRAAQRRQRKLRRVALGAGALLVAVGVTVLLGWQLDVEVMKSFGSGFVPMKVHTAFALIEVGALIAVAAVRPAFKPGPWLAVLVAVVPALTLYEYVSGESLGIDNAFGADGIPADEYPGRMAPMTAIGLVALSAGLVGTFLKRQIAAQVAALAAVLVATTAVVGYAFGVESLYQVQGFASIAVNTSVCLGLAGAAILALNTSAGILSVIVGTTAGGVVGRALLPPIAIYTLVLSGLVLLGVVQGNYDYRFGFALVAVANIVGGVTLVLLLSYVLRNSDLRRAGAEAALQEAHEQSAELVATNAVLNDFAAMAAHDLRGPLAAVRGYAELLEDELGEPERDEATQRDLLIRIQRSARRGDEMITDMLAFARLGAQLPEPEEVDLAAEVEAVAGEVTETYQRPVQVEVLDLPHVRVDRGLFRLVLTNVLGNAAKYVPTDRAARVVVDSVPRGEGEYVVIRFADNGDGIPAADRDRLMRMFERGSNDHDVAGTGIGLSICGRVAEVHGGRFWIEDAPGGGARFCLALPART